jgi:hypothetical protein
VLTSVPFEKKTITRESEEAEWRKKFGDEAAKVIRKCVDDNVADYEYLKKFAFKIPTLNGNGSA